MSDVTVRPLTQEDWQTYRAARLAALEESPQAFVATAAEESAMPDETWQERMVTSRRFIAENGDGSNIGVVSVQEGTDAGPTIADLYGLWVSPNQRGRGVAAALVKTAAAAAEEDGMTQLTYWVGTDNAHGVAFASGFGFRPTDRRRPTRIADESDSDEEIQMVLPLGADRAAGEF